MASSFVITCNFATPLVNNKNWRMYVDFEGLNILQLAVLA